MPSNTSLLERLQNPLTKQAAFAELVALYKERLYFQIRSIVLNHDDADDVLQETFIKIHQNIAQFKGNSQLFSWMYRIATNLALDFIKSKSHKNSLSTQQLNEYNIDQLQADELFDEQQAEILLQKAIHELPTKQQLVFKMKYFQDIDYQTMSEVLDTSVGALKASYHHACKKIELFLKNH